MIKALLIHLLTPLLLALPGLPAASAPSPAGKPNILLFLADNWSWPAGDPKAYFAVGDYGDVDGSRAKAFILAHLGQPEMKKFFDLSFDKRPGEELFDLRTDPHQLTNVANRSEYDATRQELRARIERWMRDTADPRVDRNYDAWDKYPYFGAAVVDKDGNPLPKGKGKTKP